MSEEKPQYIVDAEKMVGAGYEVPSVILESPRVYTARQSGKMVEVEEPAWVKFSTGFKKELALMDEHSLKVFLYIGLSINWQTGVSYPGTRNIAKETGMAPNTVTKAVRNLEELGFLEIFRSKGNPSEYKPVRYISIGTVVQNDTVPSQKTDGLSQNNEEPSQNGRVNLLNKNNKKEQDIIDGEIKHNLKPNSIREAMKAFPFNVKWESKTGREFMEWAVAENITPEQVIRAANIWKSEKTFNWQVPTLMGVFEKWPALMSFGGIPQTRSRQQVLERDL